MLPELMKTILVADSDTQNLAFLESILRNDYMLLTAEDGEQAQKILQEKKDDISLVLLDASLPKIDALRLIQDFQFSALNQQLPFIVMTSDTILAQKAIRIGTQFIRKPFTEKAMVKARIDGAIKSAEQIYQVALNYMEYIPGGVVLFRIENGKVLYVNERVLKIFECQNKEDFLSIIGNNFRNGIIPEDYAIADAAIQTQIKNENRNTSQIVFRIKTKKGNIKRIYHIGRIFSDTPYGRIFSEFISEDDTAMKEYLSRKKAFDTFMNSGELTDTKSFEPGYKAYIIWNLSANSTMVKVQGISYIPPPEMKDHYTFEDHVCVTQKYLAKEGIDTIKLTSYTRGKLLSDFANKRPTPPLSLSYQTSEGRFTIQSAIQMIADPDSGDVYLKLQNTNMTDLESYRELANSVILNLYDQIIYIDCYNKMIRSVSGDLVITRSETASNGEYVAYINTSGSKIRCADSGNAQTRRQLY